LLTEWRDARGLWRGFEGGDEEGGNLGGDLRFKVRELAIWEAGRLKLSWTLN